MYTGAGLPTTYDSSITPLLAPSPGITHDKHPGSQQQLSSMAISQRKSRAMRAYSFVSSSTVSGFWIWPDSPRITFWTRAFVQYKCCYPTTQNYTILCRALVSLRRTGEFKRPALVRSRPYGAYPIGGPVPPKPPNSTFSLHIHHPGAGDRQKARWRKPSGVDTAIPCGPVERDQVKDSSAETCGKRK